MCRLFCSLAILMALSSSVFSKNIIVIRGIMGNVLSPMNSITNGLRAHGHHVTVAEWNLCPSGRFDVAVGHSAGGWAALATRSHKIITIDPNMGVCPEGSTCINYYAAIPVSGATNIRVACDHVSMPEVVASRVISEASK